MDASTLVDELLASEELTALLATDPYGNPAIYQISWMFSKSRATPS